MFSSTIPSVKVVRSIEVVRDQIARLHRSMMPAAAVMMELVTGAWVAQAIVAAADLGIADALADGPLSADELATAVNAEADTINRLLRALITRGIFRQHRDGRYDLTPLADSLRSDAEVSLAAFARFVGSPQHREHWSHLTDAIRTGRAVIPALRGKTRIRVPARRTGTRRNLQRRHDELVRTGSRIGDGRLRLQPYPWPEPRPYSRNIGSPSESALLRGRSSTPYPLAVTPTF